MKNIWLVNKLLLALLIILLSAPVIAGVIGDSPYDGVYDIIVTSIDGTTEIYSNCVITNIGQWSISFIPDQGRIQTGNGKQIIVNKVAATVTMVEK